MKNTNLYSKQPKEIWSDKSWTTNFFHPKQGPASLLSTRSWQFWVNEAVIWCEGCQRRERWMVSAVVRHRGSAQAFGVVTGNGRSGRTRPGEGYQGVFPLMHQNLLFMWPLCWQRTLWQLLLSDFSFSPCSAGDGPEQHKCQLECPHSDVPYLLQACSNSDNYSPWSYPAN